MLEGNNIFEFEKDVPQTRLPISNTKSAVKKVNFKGKYLYAFPQVDWNAAKVRKNADPYQAILSRPLKSSVMAGMAVPTIVKSKETYKSVSLVTVNNRR